MNFTLCLFPRIEELVHTGVRILPMDFLNILSRNLLSLSNDLFARRQSTFTVLGTFLLLSLAQLNNAFVQCGQALLQACVIAHHIAHTNLRTDGGDTLLQICRRGIILDTRFEQRDLCLNVLELAGEICQGFFFGCTGQLPYGVLFTLNNHKNMTVIGYTTKLTCLLKVYLGVVGFNSHRYNSHSLGA